MKPWKTGGLLGTRKKNLLFGCARPRSKNPARLPPFVPVDAPKNNADFGVAIQESRKLLQAKLHHDVIRVLGSNVFPARCPEDFISGVAYAAIHPGSH